MLFLFFLPFKMRVKHDVFWSTFRSGYLHKYISMCTIGEIVKSKDPYNWVEKIPGNKETELP